MRNKFQAAGSRAALVQLMSVTAPTWGLVGTWSVTADVRGKSRTSTLPAVRNVSAEVWPELFRVGDVPCREDHCSWFWGAAERTVDLTRLIRVEAASRPGKCVEISRKKGRSWTHGYSEV